MYSVRMSELFSHHRDPGALLAKVHGEWGGHDDLWIFGYASLIWRPEFDYTERHPVRIHGWHRALKMWSRINRGTPANPGLVFALLAGGSCHGMVFRVPHRDGHEVLQRLWQREMVMGVYTPRWLRCATPHGERRALAFTLSRRSPSFTGALSEAQYRQIFEQACGHCGSTLDYVRQTCETLRSLGIRDRELERLLALAHR